MSQGKTAAETTKVNGCIGLCQRWTYDRRWRLLRTWPVHQAPAVQVVLLWLEYFYSYSIGNDGWERATLRVRVAITSAISVDVELWVSQLDFVASRWKQSGWSANYRIQWETKEKERKGHIGVSIAVDFGIPNDKRSPIFILFIFSVFLSWYWHPIIRRLTDRRQMKRAAKKKKNWDSHASICTTVRLECSIRERRAIVRVVVYQASFQSWLPRLLRLKHRRDW